MSNLTYEQQKLEYQNNLNRLQTSQELKILQLCLILCGDYDQNTLDVLKQLGIRLGFRANMSF